MSAIIQTFDVDWNMIGRQYWAQFEFTNNSTPSKDDVDELVIKVASEVSAAVLTVGAIPSTVRPATSPMAYSWLQDTVALGTAARAGRTMSGGDPELCREYQRMYDARMKMLRENPNTVIPDLYDDIAEPAGEVRSHVKKLGHSDSRSDDPEYTNTLKMEDDL